MSSYKIIDNSKIKPFVSVAMLTYNHGLYVNEAIDSILMQVVNFPIKIIIADDSSNDNTRDIILDYQSKFPDKIKLILQTTNVGLTQNNVDLLSNLEGKYIAALEGDDYWTDPLKLQKQVDFLEIHPEVVFSFTRFLTLQNTSVLTDYNERFFKNEENIVFDFEMFTKGWYGGTLTLLFRASAISMDAIRQYKHFRDIYLYTELLKVGNGICLNFNSAVYRTHDTGVHSSASQLERSKTAVACYYELYTNNDTILALKVKYYYFTTQYIRQLIKNSHILTAVAETLKFAFKMKDFGFLIKIVKDMIKSNKLTSFIKSFVTKKKSSKPFKGSEKYWEDRYLANKNSGAGSYGRLADFKAEILNDFVEKEHLQTVIEYGCGDGHQLSLAQYPNYVGFDVSNKALDLCRNMFIDDASKSFYSTFNTDYNSLKADLVLSLDVIYHLIEDAVFHDYMFRLFSSSNKFVIIYSSNFNKQLTAHVKCRKFTDWIEDNQSGNWDLITYIENRYPFDEKNPNNTSMADFYIYRKIKHLNE